MMQQVTRFTSNIENKISHWIVESDTSIDVAERMCMQFIQQLGVIKAQQTQAQPPQESKEDDAVVENMDGNEVIES